jgi:hypothetical protein
MSFLIKTTFSYAGLEQGWSETFYWLSDTDDLDTAETLVTPLAQKRARLLANGYVLTIVRNAVVLDAANAKVTRVTDLAELRIPGVAAWAPAQPNVALMCVWQTGDNKQSKKLYLRGVPAGIGDTGKLPDFNFASFGSNFNQWRSAMIAFKVGWLRGVTTQTTAITSFTVDAVTARVSFVLGTGFNPWPVPFWTQTRVEVSVPGKSPLDGPLIVVPIDQLHCYTPQGHPTPIPSAGQFGKMTLKAPLFTSLAPVGAQGKAGAIHPQRMVTHKTGRPSYASRGRRAGKTVW